MPPPASPLPVTSNTPETQPTNRAYYPALDGLRASALLLVFAHHYLNLPWGWAGVDLFFVLSGFLITGILVDSRDANHRFQSFYIRRTLRIFPLYYAVLFGLFALTPLLRWRLSWAWIAWPLYLGNLVRFLGPPSLHPTFRLAANAALVSLRPTHFTLYLGHLWSLSLEEQFYLLWPWIVFSVRSPKKLLCICGITVVLTPFLRVLAVHTLPPCSPKP